MYYSTSEIKKKVFINVEKVSLTNSLQLYSNKKGGDNQ